MNGRFSGKIGENYDLFRCISPNDEEVQAAIGNALGEYCKGIHSEKINVLEIGAGTGRTSKKILDADPRIILTSIDNEPAMIEQLMKNLRGHIGEGRLKILQKDALEALGKIDNWRFNAFASAQTLHNFDRGYRKACLAELYRILMPGGLFVNGDKYAVEDNARHSKDLALRIKRFADVCLDKGKPELGIEWVNHLLLDNQPDFIMKEQESVQLMENLGFLDVKIAYRSGLEAVITAVK